MIVTVIMIIVILMVLTVIVMMKVMWLGSSVDLVPRFRSGWGFSTTFSPRIAIPSTLGPLCSSFSFSRLQVRMLSSNLLKILVIMQFFHYLTSIMILEFFYLFIFFNKFQLITERELEWVLLIITIIIIIISLVMKNINSFYFISVIC